MEKINKNILSIAFVLDPRTYKFSIPIVNERIEMEKIFAEYFKNNYLNLQVDGNSIIFPKKKSALQNVIGEFCEEFVTDSNHEIQLRQQSRDELKDYLNSCPYFSENAGENFEVLDWWKKNNDRFPLMGRMARDFLGIPASSAPAERLFSAADNFMDTKRNRLSAESFRFCLCLQSWFKLKSDILKT